MSIRKLLPSVLMVVALLASTAAFAADTPAVALSQDEFLATLQVEAGAGGEQAPELDGMQAPIDLHGTSCYDVGVECRPCTLSTGAQGLKGCTLRRCLYNGSWHGHYVACSSCATNCSI